MVNQARNIAVSIGCWFAQRFDSASDLVILNATLSSLLTTLVGALLRTLQRYEGRSEQGLLVQFVSTFVSVETVLSVMLFFVVFFFFSIIALPLVCILTRQRVRHFSRGHFWSFQALSFGVPAVALLSLSHDSELLTVFITPMLAVTALLVLFWLFVDGCRIKYPEKCKYVSRGFFEDGRFFK